MLPVTAPDCMLECGLDLDLICLLPCSGICWKIIGTSSGKLMWNLEIRTQMLSLDGSTMLNSLKVRVPLPYFFCLRLLLCLSDKFPHYLNQEDVNYLVFLFLPLECSRLRTFDHCNRPIKYVGIMESDIGFSHCPQQRLPNMVC